MIARAVLAALALLAAAAAPAAAADVSLSAAPAAGVRLGSDTTLSGRVTEAGAPVAGRTVRLELREHPFTGPWRGRGEAVTAPDGGYAFRPRLRRNHQARVVLLEAPPAPGAVSPIVQAYVLPAFTLSYRQRGARAIRIRQVYTVPRSVRLSAPTRFYVGPCKPNRRGECTARRAPFAKQADTERLRAGRYVARATVRIPAWFDGRFSYVSCFGYSAGSGLGNPELRCPRTSVALR